MAAVGIVEEANSTSTALGANEIFTGVAVDVSKYYAVTISCKSDQAGTLYVDFSVDGSNWDSTLTFPFDANINEVHRLSISKQYFRIRIVNGSTPQSYLRAQVLLGNQTALTSALNSTVQNDGDSIVSRSVLMGQTDGGDWNFVPVTSEGHLEISVHDPLTVFGAIETAEDTPIFQSDFVYGINSQQIYTVTNGTGTTSGTNELMQLYTGTGVGGFAVGETRKRLRYRAGQGVKVMFTAMYTTPVAYSYQGVGCGTAENGVYFGYGDTNDLTHTDFGILYVYNGLREIKTLTVTTGATSASNVTITLNGTAFTVPVTASSNIQRTVYEIATYTGYTGWNAYPNGSTVVFINKNARLTAGTQSFSAGTTGAAATIAQTRAGAASTDTFIKQSEWNIDKLDGTGASGFTLNPQTLNIYRIKIGYLGAHDIIFQVKVTPSGTNNSIWVTCHSIKFANLNTNTNFTNAAFPFNSFAYSAGSTTNLCVKCGSVYGAIEGKKILNGNRASYANELATITNSAYTALFSVLNPRVFNGKVNQGVINIISLSGALKHNNPCRYTIVRNGTLAGNPNFQPYSSTMLGLVDTSATTVTWSDNNQMIFNDYLGDTGDLDKKFGNGEYNGEEFTIQPGDYITVCAKSFGSGSPTWVTASLNTRDDI